MAIILANKSNRYLDVEFGGGDWFRVKYEEKMLARIRVVDIGEKEIIALRRYEKKLVWRNNKELVAYLYRSQTEMKLNIHEHILNKCEATSDSTREMWSAKSKQHRSVKYLCCSTCHLGGFW